MLFTPTTAVFFAQLSVATNGGRPREKCDNKSHLDTGRRRRTGSLQTGGHSLQQLRITNWEGAFLSADICPLLVSLGRSESRRVDRTTHSTGPVSSADPPGRAHRSLGSGRPTDAECRGSGGGGRREAAGPAAPPGSRCLYRAAPLPVQPAAAVWGKRRGSDGHPRRYGSAGM